MVRDEKRLQKESMHLKGQLHVHTTFSDGRLTLQEATDVYEDLGFDFIAITDHDHLLKPAYRAAVEGVRSNLLVFFGIELTLHTRCVMCMSLK